jgi:hypothetical protein
MGFTISTKSSNSPLPQAAISAAPSLQEQIDPTVWTDGMSVGRARTALPIQIKLKNPSQWDPPVAAPLKKQTLKIPREQHFPVVLLANARPDACVLALLLLSFLPVSYCMPAIADQKFSQLYLQGHQPLQNCPEKLL